MRKVSLIAGCVLFWTSLASAQDIAPGPFNAAQVEAGRQAFIQHCMVCHGAKLQGIGDAQVLVGKDFLDAWGKDTIKELFTAVRVEMPQNDPGSLSDEMYLNLVAFLLHANGARTGTAALTAD